MVAFLDDHNDFQIGRLGGRGRTITTLTQHFVDNSGFSTPIDSNDPLDLRGWNSADWEDVTRVALWGRDSLNFRPIRGQTELVFPPDAGWSADGRKGTFHLSSLSVSSTTKIFTNRRFSARAKGEHAWEMRFPHLKFPWKKIWASLGSFLATPHDEHQWWRMAHRATFVLNNDPHSPTKRCRACRRLCESKKHLLICRRLLPITTWMAEVRGAMGDTEPVNTLMWFGVDANGSILPSPTLSLIRITWRVYYRNLTRVSQEKEIFSPNRVIRETAQLFASRMQAKQGEKRRFFNSRIHTTKKYILPNKAVLQMEPIGSLDPTNGEIEFNHDLVELMKAQGAWHVPKNT